jgi:hypothetical protein
MTLLFSGLILLLGGRFGYLHRHPRPRPAITRDNFERLEHGMALADVEAILRGPPGDYGGGHRKYAVRACKGWICGIFYDWKYERKEHTAGEIDAIASRERIAIWWGMDDAIAVQLDEDGKVIALGHGRAVREPSAWDSIKDWLAW